LRTVRVVLRSSSAVNGSCDIILASLFGRD
jgi:hypothetical protein